MAMNKEIYVPEGFTLPEVMSKLEHTVRLLASQFVFGYYDLDDIKQEARKEGIRKLPRYDSGGFDELGVPRKKLENFFYSIIKNHLINLIRDKSHRSDPPCKKCHTGDKCSDGQYCEKYKAWKTRNRAKANLVRPVNIENVVDEHEQGMRTDSDIEQTALANEAIALINERLPPELRSDYLRMRANESLPKSRRVKVETAVREILKGFFDAEEENDEV